MSAPQRPLNGEQILQRIGAEATGRDLITAADAATARAAIEAQQQNDGLDFIASSNPTDPGQPPGVIPGSTYVLGTQGWQLTMREQDIQDKYLDDNSIWLGDSGVAEPFATGAKGRDLLAAADAAAARGTLDLGTAATADVTTSATDSTTGRVTRVGDGGLLAGGQIPPVNTLSTDDRPARGFLYRIQSNTGDMPSAPRPFANGMGIECAHNASRALQIMASTNTGSLELYARVTNDADSTGVKEIYHTGNVVGTVSESGGTPTGAVIERGSNSDGEWTKFADGTMIQYGVAGSNSSGDAREVPLPQGFVDDEYAPVISTRGLAPRTHAFANRTTTSFEHQSYNDAGGRSASQGRYIAIGRWF